MSFSGHFVPPHTAIALETTFEAIAIITTVLRLWHRISDRRFGWDDLWALLAIVFSIVPYILFVISATDWRIMMVSNSVATFSRIGALAFYSAALWSAKMSVAVTIVRLSTYTFQNVARMISGLFVLSGIALVLQKVFICGTNFKTMPMCQKPKYTGYLELSLDLLGDIWLIGGPFYMLYKMKLASQSQRLISAVFTCGLFATAASIVHAYYVIKIEDILMLILGQIQVALAIICCNLLVLVTYIYRRMTLEGEDTVERTESEDPSSNGRGIPATLNPRTMPSYTPSSEPTMHITFTDIETDGSYAIGTTPSGGSPTPSQLSSTNPEPPHTKSSGSEKV